MLSKKARIKEAVERLDMYADVLFWASEINYRMEGSYDEDNEEEIPVFNVDYGDEAISNAYVVFIQLLLLYAEKENVIPRFSNRLQPLTDIGFFRDAELNMGRPVFYEAFLKSAEEYGYYFPADMNLSHCTTEYLPATSSVLELNVNLQLKIFLNNFPWKMCARTKAKRLREFELLKEQNNGVFKDYLEHPGYDAISCMMHSGWRKAQIRHSVLRKKIRAGRRAELEALYDETASLFRRVFSDNTLSCNEGDYIEFGDGSGAYVTYCTGFWCNEYCSYAQFRDPCLIESFPFSSILEMRKPLKKLRELNKMLTLLEREAKQKEKKNGKKKQEKKAH